MPEDKGICFVICPIGEEGSKERKRSDGVLEFLIKPAAEELGYRAERTIEAPKPGWITERIVRLLLDSPMVVADLNGRNPNVFYELAIRHVVRKPFVQIMQADEEVPFDVSGLHMIFYEYGDWSSAAAAREQLVEQMRIAAEHPEAIRTPVSIAGDLEALQGGQAPTEALLRDILETQREVLRRLDAASLDAQAGPVQGAMPSGGTLIRRGRPAPPRSGRQAAMTAIGMLPPDHGVGVTERGVVVQPVESQTLLIEWNDPLLSGSPEEIAHRLAGLYVAPARKRDPWDDEDDEDPSSPGAAA